MKKKKEIKSKLMLILAAAAMTNYAYSANEKSQQVSTKCNDVKNCQCLSMDNPIILGKLMAQNIVNQDPKKSHRYTEYARVCSVYGLLKLAEATGDNSLVKQALTPYEWYTKKNNYKKIWKGHVDGNVFGIVPLEWARQSGDAAYRKLGLYLANDELKELRKEDGLVKYTRFWIDDMWMVGALQALAYEVTKKQKYADIAVHQLVVYSRKLQKENGLFFHRPDVPFFWGRGNGWSAASMAKVLEVVPNTTPEYNELKKYYVKMMDGLVANQSKDGVWKQLIDDQDSWDESSCTGMFLYALATGLRTRLLSGKKYEQAVAKGWKGLAKMIDRKGRALDVCIGTGAVNSKKHYLKRPTKNGDFHGQAGVIWAIDAIIRLNKSRNKK
ncbi:glycoside hydrolase family 88 protein [Lentisphaerota bacterium WC36G]|nr:glycoside hydrolase family 88 protein [Lentisphaerae bacterium WC36]